MITVRKTSKLPLGTQQQSFSSLTNSNLIPNNNTCNRELKILYPWLKEVDKFAITNAIYNLDNAYKRYMNKLSSKPRFKKKNKGESYQTNYTNNNIEVLDNYIKLPKLGKVPANIRKLLAEYNSKRNKTIDDIINFQYFRYRKKMQGRIK